jgi:hypothetical protein
MGWGTREAAIRSPPDLATGNLIDEGWPAIAKTRSRVGRRTLMPRTGRPILPRTGRPRSASGTQQRSTCEGDPCRHHHRRPSAGERTRRAIRMVALVCPHTVHLPGRLLRPPLVARLLNDEPRNRCGVATSALTAGRAVMPNRLTQRSPARGARVCRAALSSGLRMGVASSTVLLHR